jgi:hypothetical protein
MTNPQPLAYPATPPGRLAEDAQVTVLAYQASRGKKPDNVLLDGLISRLAEMVVELNQYQGDAVNPAAALLIPCDPPDMPDGLCHEGEAWPCARTVAGWALRGEFAAAHIAEAKAKWLADMAAAGEQPAGTDTPS